ncbi:PLP-dependent aminotransferase family protein [Rhizobium sp. SG2393]|uniref:aminotransferase-like domain-containing protein n=1 Tax=Rhizobium sp. SG2393 TaxID=3276279 RepID=UPI00366E6D27
MAEAPRIAVLMSEIRRRLESRMLVAGDRLPSVRGFARMMGVSPSTVVDAYERLAAEGLIRARPGSGFYVIGQPPALDISNPAPGRDRAIDPLWVSRQSLDAADDVLRPGCGWLPADWMPHPALRRAIRRLATAPDTIFADYGQSRGSLGLRRLLSRHACEEGLEASPDMVLMTASGSQSLDLVCRHLLQPCDTVVVDDPCYFNFQAMLRAHRAKLVSVPFTPSGPDLAAFAAVLETHKPRLYVTNAALHNPTGATLSPQTAHRLLTLAALHDLTIVEDDIFAALEPEPSVRLTVLDGLERVIRIGSFSKTLSASVRCGYVIARRDRIEALTDIQVATSFGGISPLAGEIVEGVLGDGSYRKHLEALRQRLAHHRRDVAARLSKSGIEPWLMPRGGFYLWCRLPEGCDSAELARRALDEKVVLAPGNVFSPALTAGGFMRINVTQMPPRAFEVIDRALRSPIT